MPLTKMSSVEERYNKPLVEVLTTLFESLGSQRRVAKELGIGQGTLSLWLLKLGLEQRTVLVPAGGSRAGAGAVSPGQLDLPGLDGAA